MKAAVGVVVGVISVPLNIICGVAYLISTIISTLLQSNIVGFALPRNPIKLRICNGLAISEGSDDATTDAP